MEINYTDVKTLAADYAAHAHNEDTQIVYLDVDAIESLIARGRATGKTVDYLAAVLCKSSHAVNTFGGAAKNDSRLTVSLLCADDRLNVLDDHLHANLKGEETWLKIALVSEANAALPNP